MCDCMKDGCNRDVLVFDYHSHHLRDIVEKLGTVHAEDIENEIDDMDWEGEGQIKFEEFKAWWVR